MKYWIQHSALILTLGMGACSSEEILLEEPMIGTEAQITEISAVIGELQYEGTNSRTAIDMGEFNSSSISLVWAENDTIGIYPTTGDQLSFPITEGKGTSVCTFNGGGWGLKTSTSYKAYSPFNRSFYFEKSNKLPVSMLGQKQSENGSSQHLGKYDLQIAEGKTPDAGKITFDFKHQVCFIRMDLKVPVNATWKSVALESDALFATEATMDLASGTSMLTNKSYSNFMSLNLNDIEVTSGNTLTAYMVVLPIDLSGKTLKVKLTDSEGNVYTSNATIANDYRNFKAGYARWIKAEDFQLTGITIHVSEAGTLSVDNQNLTSLKITGKINGTDILHIRNLSGFEYIDLSEVQISSGGDSYYKSGNGNHYTYDNTIGQYMFYSLTNLKHVILPESATYIDNSAFENCSNLRSIFIPDNITRIEDSAFSGCANLVNVYLSKNLTRIGRSVFEGCTSLQNIVLPSSLMDIGGQAFYNCTSLTSIALPSNVTFSEITGTYIFAGCTSLKNVSISEGIKLIPQDMFRGCTVLKEVTIPASVTTIGGLAFYQSGLEKVYIHCTTPPTMTTSFYEIPSSCVLYVPKGCAEAYSTFTTWETSFSDIIEMEE